MKKKSFSNQQRLQRFRVILAVIIAATIPCYCSGLILLQYYPQDTTKTPTPSLELTTPVSTLNLTTPTISMPTITNSPTATLTPRWTASMTYTPFLSPTTTITITMPPPPTYTHTPLPTATEIIPDTAVPINTPTLTQSAKPTEEVTP